MATYRKRGNKWRAEIFKNGIRMSRTFETKAQAMAWATQKELDIDNRKYGRVANKTFADLLDKYQKEITIHKKTAHLEINRIDFFKKQDFAKLKLEDLTDDDFKAFRDMRLKQVLNSTVIRELSILSSVCNTAIREWKWLKTNPVSAVKRPKSSPPRDRRIAQEEIDAILRQAEYTHEKPKSPTQVTACAFLFAIETGMRQGEILKIKPEHVDFEKRIVSLYATKNGTDRQVPLSSEAIRILKQIDCNFSITPRQIKYFFAQLTKSCNIDNLHFHDTRHEAITRLAKIFGVLDLARIVGHRDIKMLQIYYNETAENLAKMLK